MAAPSFVSVEAFTQNVGSLTNNSCSFGSAVTAGTSFYAFIYTRVDSSTASDPIASVAAAPGGGGSSNMSLVAYKTLKYESNKRLSLYRLTGLANDTYTITVTCNGVAGSTSISGAVVNVSGDGSITALANNSTYNYIDSENGVNSITFPTLPASGSFNSNEVLLISASATSDGSDSDIQWQGATGHTQAVDQGDNTGGKGAFSLSHNTPASSNAISGLTYTSTDNDSFGRVGILLALVNESSPTIQKVKVVNEDDSITTSGVKATVCQLPSGDHWIGRPIFTVSDLTWVVEDVGGTDKSVLYITIPDSTSWLVSGITIAADDILRVVGGEVGTGGDLMGDSGFKGIAEGTVIEV